VALPRRLITQTHGMKIIVGCKASELGLEAGPLESISSFGQGEGSEGCVRVGLRSGTYHCDPPQFRSGH